MKSLSSLLKNININININIKASLHQLPKLQKLSKIQKLPKNFFCENNTKNNNTQNNPPKNSSIKDQNNDIFQSLLSRGPSCSHQGEVKISNDGIHQTNEINTDINRLLQGNKIYVAEKTFSDPDYFRNTALTQKPKYLMIGCSDSRVPPNEITKTKPGEIFIHRNIANQVSHFDLNCMSVIQYAVEYLKVEHVIVMGHTKCGGIIAANDKKYLGLISQWLINIKDIANIRSEELAGAETQEEFIMNLTEVNVKMQCLNVCKTPFVQKAWSEGRNLQVHGWVVDIETGLIKDLSVKNKDWNDLKNIYNYKF